ncbi:MAG: peptidase, partial [Spirosoma sp.]|nr:peptidase [Spirosoma sp.]
MTSQQLIVAAGLITLPFISSAQGQFANTITASDLEKHLRILAADDMEGRETGTRGQRKAAEYIASQFAAEGLKPIVKADDGKEGYQQPYTLYKKTWGDFYIRSGGKQFALLKDFMPNGLLYLPSETTYETLFVGYGISDKNYDNYAGRDVKGKAVVVLDDEPKTAEGKKVVSGTEEASKWGGPNGWRAKSLLAKEKGAVQVFIVSAESAEDFKRVLTQRSAMQARFNRMSLKPGAENVGSTGVFLISTEMAATLLNTPVATLSQTMTQLAKSEKPMSSSLAGSVAVKADRIEEKTQSSNVLGFIEGTDKKDEVLIVSSHYDHIGISADGQINNGANDDGSGTVSVLEIAQAFAKAKADGKGPRRSILFLTVSGEEKGLLGSEYYADMSPVI